MPRGNYTNPPIEEALCEYTFALPAGAPQWDLTLPGKYQMHALIRDTYTGTARQQNLQNIIVPSPVQPGFGFQAAFRVQIPNAEGTRLVALGQNTLTVSVLKPYDGWHNFKPRIEAALNAYYELVKPLAVTRIGVRYVNRIAAPRDNHDPERYLVLPHPEDAALDAKLFNFMRRGEYRTVDGVKLLITQASLQPVLGATPPGTTDYLLDIDVVWDHQPLTELTTAIETTEQLHALEGAAFEALITEEARRIFVAS